MHRPVRYSPCLALVLTACGGYRDFTLPTQPGGSSQIQVEWHARPDPVLTRGQPGHWDSVDVLNPSVVRLQNGYLNLYSGFDGKTWHTGAAFSPDGYKWTKAGKILSPNPATWEGNYIAANGSALLYSGSLWYYYQAARPPQIGLLRILNEGTGASGSRPRCERIGGAVLEPGPYGSWDERGVADPYVLSLDGKLYMYYLGMDRARRQRLGVAFSDHGRTWHKLRSNPILQLGEYGSFDENGLGEPAVWSSSGFYWMLYTGRDRNERRRLGLARSTDGVRWEKLPDVFRGDQPWTRR